MFWPCETRTSICRNLATISSGLYRFLAITVLLDVKDIPQVGPLQWGWITFMMTKNIIVIAAMFMFALTVGILTANLAESGNDRASGPTIGTLALQY